MAARQALCQETTGNWGSTGSREDEALSSFGPFNVTVFSCERRLLLQGPGFWVPDPEIDFPLRISIREKREEASFRRPNRLPVAAFSPRNVFVFVGYEIDHVDVGGSSEPGNVFGEPFELNQNDLELPCRPQICRPARQKSRSQPQFQGTSRHLRPEGHWFQREAKRPSQAAPELQAGVNSVIELP